MKYLHPRKWYRQAKDLSYRLFWYYLVPDRLSIKHSFRKRLGYPCNLRAPQSYNEKIQWLKLNDRNPLYRSLCDKYEVKGIVASWIGNQYIIPTLGEWQRFEDIDFSSLPSQFVLKCNHDSASTVICYDKSTLDFPIIKEKLTKALRYDYYHDMGKQWAYKGIKRCIIAEPLLKDDHTTDLIDYKFMVFNCVCRCVLASSERFSPTGTKMDFYDMNWNLLPFTRHFPNSKGGINRPVNFDLMVSLAETIAKKIGNPFIRVDFYEVNSKVYFGETTFYPGGGLNEFNPREWDFVLGSWMDLG